jgi:hypothetical protein
LPEAVEKKVFGHDEDGEGIHPDEQEVAVITQLHGEKLIAAIVRITEAEELLRRSMPSNRAELVLRKDVARSAYLGLIAVYAEDFGEKAARELDAWAHDQHEHGEGDPHEYDPGHPWHYYRQGDAATPTPVEQIRPAPNVDPSPFGTLPRSAAGRAAKIEAMLRDRREQLRRDSLRYQDLVDRGVDALGEHDRSAADNGDDELSWASAVALTYHQIREGLARVAWLEERLKTPAAARPRSRPRGSR